MKITKQVSVYLYTEAHKALKIVAVEKETTVSEIVREIVMEYLTKGAK